MKRILARIRPQWQVQWQSFTRTRLGASLINKRRGIDEDARNVSATGSLPKPSIRN